MITLHLYRYLGNNRRLYCIYIYCIHYIRVFTTSSLTVLVLTTAQFPFWSFLLLGWLLYYFIILTPSFHPYAWWRNVLQWWLTPAVLILHTIWATSLIGLMAIQKLCDYLLFYFLNLAHECRRLPVTCHAGTEDRHAVVLILNLRATWGFTLGPCCFSPEKGPEGQHGQV